MKLIITKHIQKELSKYHLDTDDLVKHFENTYLGSNKCIKLGEFIGTFDIYKSYLTGTHRLVSFIVTHDNTIIPAYIGDKRDPIARNISKRIIQTHAYIWLHKIECATNDDNFETIYLHK